MLLVAAILSVIMAVLFYAMNAGNLSFNLSSARAELQGEVRRAMDWIVKDVHQTVNWEIAKVANNPNSSHIKFKQVTGWDTVNNTFLLSDYYVEYTYDAAQKIITRSGPDPADPAQIKTWTFNYIDIPVNQYLFNTLDSGGQIVPLNATDLGTSKQIVIRIFGQNQVIGGQNTTYNLFELVKIRNG